MQELEGQVIADKYRLVQFLSEGTFGMVFRASHVAFELEMREVAVKIGKHPMTNHEARKCFNDALIMARVAHAASEQGLGKYFVTVFDAGLCPEGTPAAGRPYMVMELVDGGSLRGCLKAGPFPLKRAAQYFDEILQAVAFMHRETGNAHHPKKCIIHRDIKPGNVLLHRTGDARDVVKIADFGLAVEIETLLGWAESGGDLAYLAPESFSHDICSPQTDVYMLGLLFYEMITGANPFAEVGSHLRGDDDAHQMELRRLHLEARQREMFGLLEAHVEMRRYPGLVQVIRRALTADMKTRPYRDAWELQEAWRRAWNEREGAGRPAEKPWDMVRRLTGEAEQRLGIGDADGAAALLRQAMELNRRPGTVPDGMLVGQTYLLYVKELLRRGDIEEAGKLAMEGHRRRRCRSTCMAMANYFSKVNLDLAQRYSEEANVCHDPE